MATRGAGSGRWLLHVGMLLCGIAFTGWYSNHTIFDTGRTERVAHTVLSDPTIRQFVAGNIEPAIALASPTAAAASASPDGSESRLAAALAEPDVQQDLEHFVGDLHRRVIGEGVGFVTLDQGAVDKLVVAAVPNIPPSELAAIPPVSFDAPQTRPLLSFRRGVANLWWVFGLLGVAMVVGAFVTTDDRRGASGVVGKWLVGLSLFQIVVLWVVPVYLVPAVTDDVWARIVSKVARALNGGLVVGLFVIAGVGIALWLSVPFQRRSAAATS